MGSESAQEIFEKYNPAQDAVRCPNGKAKLRDLLDSYAKAAVNLYGIISRKSFVELFNKQNAEQTTEEEIYRLLLPRVLKRAPYGFYNNYLVNASFYEDFSKVDDLAKIQLGKPTYIPDKNEFLQFGQLDYIESCYLMDFQYFFWSEFRYGPKTKAALDKIIKFVILGDQFYELSPIMSQYDLILSSEKKLRQFIELVTNAKNYTRIWEHKGHTPDEIFKMHSQSMIGQPAAVPKPRTKVGRNDPCPCGSGKKFKKCCGLYDDTKTAQLSPKECREFYELWYGLMGYVNEREHMIREKIKPEYPNAVSDSKIYDVRQVLWEKPELIDEYISEGKLSQDKIEILKLWRTNHKKGILFLVDYQPEFAVALTSNAQGEDTLYGVKGISTSLANSIRRVLPTSIETVLLPFKGKIVYDSFIHSLEIGFGEGAQKNIREMYERVNEHGIITNLE